MPVSDEELVAVVVAVQDRAAFAELVRRYHRPVRSMLARLCSNRALADDLAVRTFVQAFAKAGSFSGRTSFGEWLYRVAYGEFRRSARERRAARRAMERLRMQAAAAPRDRDGGAVEDLDRALESLEETERVAVVLRYGCGLAPPQMSAATGMSEDRLQGHLARGRNKLKAFFQLETKDPP